jgi:hypothetical protein
MIDHIYKGINCPGTIQKRRGSCPQVPVLGITYRPSTAKYCIEPDLGYKNYDQIKQGGSTCVHNLGHGKFQYILLKMYKAQVFLQENQDNLGRLALLGNMAKKKYFVSF